VAACAAAPALLFARGALGGGDLKLFAALGAILGAGVGLEIELGSFILAALFALGRLAWQGKLVRTLFNSVCLLLNAFLPSARRHEIRPELMSSVRMGGAILAAAFMAFCARAPLWWLW
jgi:prepilin peptidase CpaA